MTAAEPPRPSWEPDAPVVVTYRSPVFNRSETFVQAQALGLRRYQPVVCGRNEVGNVALQLQDRLILAHRWLERLRMDILGPGPRYAERLAWWRPALIHAHFATDGMAALPLARRLNVPLVTSLRGYDLTRSTRSMLLSGAPSKIRYALLGSRLRRAGDLFLPVCDFLRDLALAQGFPAERTITHYNGVDLATFRPGGSPPNPGLILHVGRLEEKKGTVVLLRAFARIFRDDLEAQLAIIGDGPLRQKLEAEAMRLGIAARINWLGARGKAEVADWMRRASLLAVPSLTARDGNSEGLPNVAVEAAASGLPVVASRHAGIPEAVRHERTGLLVPEGDPDAFSAALASLLRSPEQRSAFGRAARGLAEEQFDYLRQMERLEALYDAVISQHTFRSGSGAIATGYQSFGIPLASER